VARARLARWPARVVDAARRQRELFGATAYRCVAPTRPKRTGDDVDVG
jgi:hypothetical protein